MARCFHCNIKVLELSKFCDQCGNPIDMDKKR